MAATLLSGCTDFDAGEGNIVVRGIDLSAPVVNSGSLLLVANVTLDSVSAASGDLVLSAKAYDSATGLVVQDVHRDVASIGKDKTSNVELGLDLPRADGYRIHVEVRRDGQLIQVAQITASNLGALQPNTHDTGLRVAGMDFEVLSTAGNRTDVLVTAYLVNEGTQDSRPLSLQLKARETSTGLLAAQTWIAVNPIGREETAAYNSTVALPEGFNYEVEAILWDGRIIVERGSGFVQFAPRTVVPPGTDIIVSTPDLDAFLRDRAQGDSGSAAKTPGPGLLVVAAALALAAVVARRSKP